MRFVNHLLVLTLIWLLLTEARWDSWIVGGPTVVVASVVATLLDRGINRRWSVAGFLCFTPYFIRNSFLSGLDVAWRAMHPRLPIDPQMVQYQLRVPNGAARIFFTNIVSLLPGTVSADVCDDVLIVHALDARQPIRQQLAELEQVVAGLFATRLDTAEKTGESTP